MNVATPPAEFREALTALRDAQFRPELKLEEVPAPARLAPYAVALSAYLGRDHNSGRSQSHDHDEELATGRFILLYDPEGSPVWEGNFRIVTYIRATLDAELGNDEMLGSVAWTWLEEALASHHAKYHALGGTATRVLSESFGSLANREEVIDVELRASWSPELSSMQDHLEAWSDMVCSFGGLPPLPEGVRALPQGRIR